MPMKARYTVANDETIAQKHSGTRSLYVPDPLGSTVALLSGPPSPPPWTPPHDIPLPPSIGPIPVAPPFPTLPPGTPPVLGMA